MQRNSKIPESNGRRGPIVLVGMMGVGKSTVGRRLAARLGLAFVDADEEIEKAAGMSVAEIFDRYGEAYFRDGERRVIARLMDGAPKVIATGGGAFAASMALSSVGARYFLASITARSRLARRVSRE